MSLLSSIGLATGLSSTGALTSAILSTSTGGTLSTSAALDLALVTAGIVVGSLAIAAFGAPTGAVLGISATKWVIAGGIIALISIAISVGNYGSNVHQLAKLGEDMLQERAIIIESTCDMGD